VDACEEISGSLFVAGCDGAKVLDDVEETFHEVAPAIEREVALARRLAICPRWNDGRPQPSGRRFSSNNSSMIIH
jgi:hypothetical protein